MPRYKLSPEISGFGALTQTSIFTDFPQEKFVKTYIACRFAARMIKADVYAILHVSCPTLQAGQSCFEFSGFISDKFLSW